MGMFEIYYNNHGYSSSMFFRGGECKETNDITNSAKEQFGHNNQECIDNVDITLKRRR